MAITIPYTGTYLDTDELSRLGLTETKTPQGGTAYKDATGRIFTRGITGFTPLGISAITTSTDLRKDITDTANRVSQAMSGITGGAVDTRFFLQPGETPEQYTSRTKQYFPSEREAQTAPTTQTPTAPQGYLSETERASFRATADTAYELGKSALAEITRGTDPHTDPSFSATLGSLNASYDTLAKETRAYNTRVEALQEKFGITTGTQRYSPLVAGGEVLQRVNEGIHRIDEIEKKRRAAIAEAYDAFQTKRYDRMTKAFSLSESLRKNLFDETKFIQERMDEERQALSQALLDTQRTLETAIKTATAVAPFVSDLLAGLPEDTRLSVLQNIAAQESIDPLLLAGEVDKYDEALRGKEMTEDIREFLFENERRRAGGLEPYKTIEEMKKSLATATRAPKAIATDVEDIGGLPDEEVERAITLATQGVKFSSVADRKDAVVTIKDLLKNDRTDEAKEQLMTYVRNSLTGRLSEVVDGFDAGLKALNRIETSLRQLEDRGINTNIFAGIAQKSLEKIGQTDFDILLGKIGDQGLAEVANDIALAIISYRRSVSGAAFTESEGKSYEQVFPNIGREKELNSAKINSLRRSFSSDREEFYRQRIGPNKYDTIFGEETDNLSRVKPNEATQILNNILEDRAEPDSVTQKSTGLRGFFNQFLNVFGAQMR